MWEQNFKSVNTTKIINDNNKEKKTLKQLIEFKLQVQYAIFFYLIKIKSINNKDINKILLLFTKNKDKNLWLNSTIII